MPAVGPHLDEQYVDALGVRVHCELQRLGEELQFDRRVESRLGQLIASVRGRGRGPVRIVDLGCGIGHVLRAMAARQAVGTEVELVGVDFNPVLVGAASGLARAEGLRCQFVVGDGLEPGVAIDGPERTIVMSTGVLHHLSPTELESFFRAQADLGVAAFAHWDICPSPVTTLGAWVFHRARMREAVSRHDGVLSARRAHPTGVIVAAASQGAGSYNPGVERSVRDLGAAIDVLRPVVGTKP